MRVRAYDLTLTRLADLIGPNAHVGQKAQALCETAERDFGFRILDFSVDAHLDGDAKLEPTHAGPFLHG